MSDNRGRLLRFGGRRATLRLARIWGVGPASAARLADASVRRPADLRADAEVRAAPNPQQRIGAARYDDLRRPIPWAEADAMLALVRDAVGRVSAGAVRVYGCGSYRRGRATSGDVNYLLVPVHARPSGDATGERGRTWVCASCVPAPRTGGST